MRLGCIMTNRARPTTANRVIRMTMKYEAVEKMSQNLVLESLTMYFTFSRDY